MNKKEGRKERKTGTGFERISERARRKPEEN